MTYPHLAEVPKETLLKILKVVDLEYLVDRNGALDSEISWEDTLSLSEKQRLAMARLIYHKPRFAILDECTSAVTADMERRLYRICVENAITYITIAHRPARRAYHKRMLSIGDGKQGYSITEIDTKEIEQKVFAAARNSVLSDSLETAIRTHKQARNAQYKAYDADKPLAKHSSTWMRAMRIWNIARPENCLLKFGG
eukprot:COSAG05_NODE_6585_length_934_cov_0.814371_1_plen_197_part_10